MKKSLTILSLSAGLLVGLSSCQSTDDYPGGYEEAIPMNEMAVADGELPPWLTEDNEDSEQIPAGAYTDYAFPDDEIKVADSGSPVSQNQPELAQDDTLIDSDTRPLTTEEGATVIPKPVSESIHGPGKPDTPIAATTKPQVKASTKTGRSTSDIKKLTANERKQIKKVQEPTVVTYRVRPGDNLSLIAKRSNTTVAQIRKDSNIKGDTIYPGQIIKVKYYPKGSKAAYQEKIAKSTTHTVKRGESVSRIAQKYGVTTGALLKANNMTMKQAAVVQPGRKLIIPDKNSGSNASATRTHTVSTGESISGIAKKYGVTTGALLKANNLTMQTASRIRPGQELTIPAKATTKKRR